MLQAVAVLRPFSSGLYLLLIMFYDSRNVKLIEPNKLSAMDEE